jgi:DNA invertase Pin-like site-specific DNA recombinase
MFLGYARVSTAEQNPDHQIDALVRAGVAAKDVYVDRASGAKASRPELDRVLRMLRDGDTLKITRLDRLGRRGECRRNRVRVIERTDHAHIYTYSLRSDFFFSFFFFLFFFFLSGAQNRRAAARVARRSRARRAG